MTGWVGGLQISGLGRGGKPQVDYLCTRCWFHIRVTDRDTIRDHAKDLPTSHRATCPALHPEKEDTP